MQTQSPVKFNKIICTPNTNILTSDTMDLSDEQWKEVGFIISSEYRTKVMKSFDGKAKIPTQLAKDSGILINHISNTLKQLKDHGLVECINPEVKKGRLYKLTNNGQIIINKI